MLDQSPSIANLATALAEAQHAIRAANKSGFNKDQKYAFATVEDLLAAIREPMHAAGLSIVFGGCHTEEAGSRNTSKGGTCRRVRVTLGVQLCHKSGEWIRATCVGEGEDTQDKAIYKALTGARKYGIAAMLNLVSSDDAESDGGAAAPASQEDAEAKAQAEALYPRAAKVDRAAAEAVWSAGKPWRETVTDLGAIVARGAAGAEPAAAPAAAAAPYEGSDLWQQARATAALAEEGTALYTKLAATDKAKALEIWNATKADKAERVARLRAALGQAA